jgi:hypothetical protein
MYMGDVMSEFLKIIHFLSFSVAIGAGVSNQILGIRMVGFAPDAMPKIGAIRLALGKATTYGLILLWITGLLLISTTSGMAILQNTGFLYKMVAVLILTAVSIMANMTIAQARKTGTPPDAARMKRLGISGLALAVVTLILAVLAFS